MFGNWFLVADVLKDPRVIKNWHKRVLIVHDVPTANNKNNCLVGDFKISTVSSTLYNMVTSIPLKKELHRVMPTHPHCGH